MTGPAGPPAPPPAAKAEPAWAAVRELFDRLAPMPAAAREAELARPGPDAAVVAEVRSLLAHESAESGGGFLVGGAPALRTAQDTDEAATERAPRPSALSAEQHAAAATIETQARAGQALGPWRIRSLLGRGGMGEVWLAERADGAYRGHAAIKVLRPGMETASVLARFAQEQRALARLAHPHIARLLDAGRTAEGLPYFVMEHVRGRPIDSVCAQLPLPARLQLFLQLTEAVSYAHRNLLVHRDLKPGNVMVDDEGLVKLLDFGIAKALDPLEGGADLTATAERPFTPHYASPEQVRGEPVTTATDIYSLGVVLYVLLTGLKPTGRRASTAAEAARSVLEEVPTRPSRLSEAEVSNPQWSALRRQLEGDLDNILMKALAKSSEQRYASVDALASDVRAYLQGQPVSARAASPGYLLAKFVQRHRFAVLTAAAGALGLMTALAATVLQGRVAAAAGVLAMGAAMLIALVQARAALLARDAATRAGEEARQQLQRVKRITHELLFRYGDTVTTLPGGAKAQEAMLRDAIELLQPALAEAPDDLDLVATMASALARLAEIQGTTMLAAPQRAADAQATVERAVALGERAWSRALADWRFANWFVRALVVKAQLQRGQGRLDDAVGTLRRAVERATAALAGRAADEGWMYLTSGVANAHIYLAQLHDHHEHLPNLGQPALALGHLAEAEAVLRAQLAHPEVLEALDRDAPPGDSASAVFVQHQLGTVIGGRALVLLRQDDLGAARREIDAAMALRRDNVAREPRNVAWRDGLMTEAGTAALILLRQGEAAAALDASTLAWQTMQDLAQEGGAGSRWAGGAVQAGVGATHGRALAANGRAAEAVPLITMGIAHWAERCAAPAEAGVAHRRVAAHHVHRAQARLALGETDAARADAQAALARLGEAQPPGGWGGATGSSANRPPDASAWPERARREAELVAAEAHAVAAQLEPLGAPEARSRSD